MQQVIDWFESLKQQTQTEAISCMLLKDQLAGYFPDEFLERCQFVVLDSVPVPDFAEVTGLSGIKGILAGFMMPKKVPAIAWQQFYFIEKNRLDDLALHCQQLVHLAQCDYLGGSTYLQLFYDQIRADGIDNADFVRMAQQVSDCLIQQQALTDIPALVAQSLAQVYSQEAK